MKRHNKEKSKNLVIYNLTANVDNAHMIYKYCKILLTKKK